MYVKCSEDSERKKRESPFSTITLSFDAPSPATTREYLHTPYTARNGVPWATFLPLKVYAYLCKFPKKIGLESRIQRTITWRTGADYNAKCHSMLFHVNYLDVTENPLSDYVLQYNSCHHCMLQFERYSTRKKRKSLFLTNPLSLDAPSPANPSHILPLIVWVYLHPNFCDWLRKTCPM